MFWSELQKFKPELFQRYTGIKLPTFLKMVEVVKDYENNHKNYRSKPFKYGIEDRVLIMLDYYREYPTFFHLGVKYKIHESTAYRIVTKLEDILIKSGAFNLPKKSSIPSNTQIEVVIIDASESPIERPKKSKHQKANYSGKKNDTL
jgi:hypothetical protein